MERTPRPRDQIFPRKRDALEYQSQHMVQVENHAASPAQPEDKKCTHSSCSARSSHLLTM